MADGHWYVRLGGQALGPLTAVEFRDLALRGSVTAQTPVSRDKINWTDAGAIQGIVFGVASPPALEVPPSGFRPPTSSGRFGPPWFLVGILLGGVGVLVCGFLLLVVIGAIAGSGESSDERSAENVTFLGTSREQIVAQRTFAYWRGIGTALTSFGREDCQTTQAAAATLRGVAAQIRALPAVETDPDVVQCGNDVATVLCNLADFIEQSNNPGILVEAFLRGANGDPLGTTAELLDAQSSIRRQLNQVQAELDNARAVLSSRYGIEFPPL